MSGFSSHCKHNRHHYPALEFAVEPTTSTPGLAEMLMANGVLQQLLTIAIDKTAKEFGEELTLVALVAVLEEWK